MLGAQDARAVQGSVADWVRQQALSTGSATVAMPERIARLDKTIGGLEQGTFRPRVRVMESERFNRRAGIMQVWHRRLQVALASMMRVRVHARSAMQACKPADNQGSCWMG